MIARWTTLLLLQICDVYIRPKIVTLLIAPFVWLSFAFSTIKGQNYIRWNFFTEKKGHKWQGWLQFYVDNRYIARCYTSMAAFVVQQTLVEKSYDILFFWLESFS